MDFIRNCRGRQTHLTSTVRQICFGDVIFVFYVYFDFLMAMKNLRKRCISFSSIFNSFCSICQLSAFFFVCVGNVSLLSFTALGGTFNLRSICFVTLYSTQDVENRSLFNFTMNIFCLCLFHITVLNLSAHD